MTVRVERVVTSGSPPDGGSEGESAGNAENTVESNVWIVGDDEDVVVVDAAHDATAILDAVGEREILAVVCTHGYWRHVDAAVEVADRDEAPICLHPADRMLWDSVHPDEEPDIDIEGGGTLEVAGEQLEVLHTPGHSPGGVSLYAPGLDVVFVGDTLGADGPGITDSSYSDLPNLLASVGEHVLALPGETRVLPARGEETTVEVLDANFDSWVTEDTTPERTYGGSNQAVDGGGSDAAPEEGE